MLHGAGATIGHFRPSVHVTLWSGALTLSAMDANNEHDGGERRSTRAGAARAVELRHAERAAATAASTSRCTSTSASGPATGCSTSPAAPAWPWSWPVSGARPCAGIDASSRLVAVARDRSPDADVRVGDMHALPWADGSFDVVTSFRGIWGTTPDAAAEVHRVLVPGGRLGLTVWGHLKASPGAWALQPFTLARTRRRSRTRRRWCALGRPGVGEELLRGAGLRRRPPGRDPVRLGVRRPRAAYARALRLDGTGVRGDRRRSARTRSSAAATDLAQRAGARRPSAARPDRRGRLPSRERLARAARRHGPAALTRSAPAAASSCSTTTWRASATS